MFAFVDSCLRQRRFDAEEKDDRVDVELERESGMVRARVGSGVIQVLRVLQFA